LRVSSLRHTPISTTKPLSSQFAVTEEQAAHYNLPTAPPKSDNRIFEGTGTVKAKALPPDVFADILRSARRSSFDVQLNSQKSSKRRQKPEQVFKNLD